MNSHSAWCIKKYALRPLSGFLYTDVAEHSTLTGGGGEWIKPELCSQRGI